jgi:hypothetical protein
MTLFWSAPALRNARTRRIVPLCCGGQSLFAYLGWLVSHSAPLLTYGHWPMCGPDNQLYTYVPPPNTRNNIASACRGWRGYLDNSRPCGRAAINIAIYVLIIVGHFLHRVATSVFIYNFRQFYFFNESGVLPSPRRHNTSPLWTLRRWTFVTPRKSRSKGSPHRRWSVSPTSSR